MQPGCRNGIDLQCFERDRAKHPIEIGGKQRIEDVPQPVIMERGTCEPWLQQRHHPRSSSRLPHFVERMMSIQNREHQGFDPTATREHMRRVGGMRRSITVATSRRRKTPRTKGKCAMG